MKIVLNRILLATSLTAGLAAHAQSSESVETQVSTTTTTTTSTSVTAPPAPVEFKPNVNRGNFLISGGLTLTDSTADGARSTFDANAGFQYFVWDRIALGLAINWQNPNAYGVDTCILGPRATYFFGVRDHIGAYVEVGAEKGLTDETVSGEYLAQLGANYFISKDIAFGPYFQADYIVRRVRANNGVYVVGAQFGLFL